MTSSASQRKMETHHNSSQQDKSKSCIAAVDQHMDENNVTSGMYWYVSRDVYNKVE